MNTKNDRINISAASQLLTVEYSFKDRKFPEQASDERRPDMNVNINMRKRETKPMPKSMLLIISILFLGLGIFFVTKIVHNMTALTSKTTATIVSIDVRESKSTHDSNRNSDAVITIDNSDKKKETYTPILEYYVEGERYEMSTGVGTNNPNEYRIGDTVEINYNAKDPAEFEISGKGFTGNLLFAAGGILFGIIGLFAFLRPR